MNKFNNANRQKQILLGDTIVGLGAVCDAQQLAQALADPALLRQPSATFFVLRRSNEINLTLKSRKSTNVSLGVELKTTGMVSNKLVVQQVYSGVFTQLGKELCTNALVSGDQILQVGDATTPAEMVKALSNWAQHPEVDLIIRIKSGRITKAPAAVTSGDGVTRTELPGGVVYYTVESKMPSIPKIPLLVVLFALLAGYVFFSGAAKFEFMGGQDPISKLIIDNYAHPPTRHSLIDITPTAISNDVTCNFLASKVYTDCDSVSRDVLSCEGRNRNEKKDYSCSSGGWKTIETTKTMSLNVNGHLSSKAVSYSVHACKKMNNRATNVCVVTQS